VGFIYKGQYQQVDTTTWFMLIRVRIKESFSRNGSPKILIKQKFRERLKTEG